MSIGILPNVNSLKTESGCKAGTSVCSCTTRLKNNQEKAFNTEKATTRSAVAIVKTLPQLGYVSQDSEPSELPKKNEVSGTGTIQSALRQASIRENQGLSHGKIQVKLPHQRSPYAMKFED